MIGAAFVFGALFVAPRIGAAAFAAATIFGSAVAALAIDHGAALRAIGAAGWQPGWHLPVTRWSDAGHGKDVLGETGVDVDNDHGLPPSERVDESSQFRWRHVMSNVWFGRMNILGPSVQREAECEEILRTLPMWFGIEDALLMYKRDSGTLPTFAMDEDGRLVGFISLTEHFAQSWEVHCIAVRGSHRGKGIGSALLGHAESWLRAKGVRFLQVKTVAATSASKEYAQTREFYRAKGYTPLEVFPTLWNPRNPALQLVKVLHAAL